MDSSIMISICCTADRSVHRPCRMMSTHEEMDGVLLVKGAAMEASPSCTMGMSPPSIWSISPAHLAAPAAKAVPCFFCSMSCSFLISSFRRPMTVFIADIWPIIPQSSPRCRLASISSSTHCCCLPIRSFRLRSISSLAFLPISICFATFSLRWISNASSASVAAPSCVASSDPPALSTLALPKPLSKARPTSASLSAPTSLPPSPHIRVQASWNFFTEWMICSFCAGDSLA
mmetsp:Transcript_14786/g.44425  ORF Transcript_14786/g.44425 Transcript_14786/m.44425 type:complete len:232 (+) Transcript_14786:999-1694(+)